MAVLLGYYQLFNGPDVGYLPNWRIPPPLLPPLAHKDSRRHFSAPLGPKVKFR